MCLIESSHSNLGTNIRNIIGIMSALRLLSKVVSQISLIKVMVFFSRGTSTRVKEKFVFAHIPCVSTLRSSWLVSVVIEIYSKLILIYLRRYIYMFELAERLYNSFG